ncbi:MAG: AsmA-like C-terminal region-containing protein [Bacteroidales bacterium]|nr:AsmA-like C-terminal region-containing protein [Bacteroidales bacterium]
MKKAIRIILRITGILILVILLAAIIIPSLFKEEIKEKVVNVANEKINAELTIGDFGITLLRNFPNLTFRLKDVSITGVNEFAGDTLAGLKSFNLVFDITSLFSRLGYRIKAIEIDRPLANALILEDGTANYDILKEGGGSEDVPDELDDNEPVPGKEGVKELNFSLKKFEIKDGSISATDRKGEMEVSIRDLDLLLSGKMAHNNTDLLLTMNIKAMDFSKGGLKYLKDAAVSSKFDIGADLQNNFYELNNNYLAINALKLIFDGSVKLEGEDITTDLNVGTEDTDFKSVLSLVPAVFMQGFEDLKTEGRFSISGDIKGRYSSADSIYPDIMLEFLVKDGFISYPDLPEQISNINLAALLTVDGSNLDNTLIDLTHFHFELAENPFDMSLSLRTPISDPEFNADFKGKIDLEALANAVPVDLNELKGIIDVALGLEGRMSMIENKDFDSFQAAGAIKLRGFEVAMEDLPPVGIEVADFNFTPRFAALDRLSMNVAGNDINLKGRLENYLPYVFRGETIRGQLELYSDYIDLDTILSYLPVDTVEVDDTLAIPTIKLPENIDFEFISQIDRLTYSPLEASDIKGNILLKEGVLLIRETGLRTLGGNIVMNAEYDSRDTINPWLNADLSVNGLGIKQSFTTFNTVKKLAPLADGMNGDISLSFDFSALLGEGMMPLAESINGSGNIISDEIQLVSSPIFNKFTSVLQIGENYTNTLKDLDVYFEVKNGRVYIKPFDTMLGDMKLNIRGDHGLDQSINYLMKLEIPSSKLPRGMSTLLTGLAANAALMGIEYYQPEVIKMDVNIGGSIKDPQVRPSLGLGGGSTLKETLQDAAAGLVEEKVEEVRGQVADEARKQADKILAEARERADLLKAEADEAARKIRLEADKNAQKLIDEAADKGALARMAAEKAAAKLRDEADIRASGLEKEAQKQADMIMEEARAKAGELIKRNN